MIVCGLLEKKWICGNCLLSVYISTAVENLIFKSGGWDHIQPLNPHNVCICYKSGQGFQTSCAVVVFLYNDSRCEVVVSFVGYWLNCLPLLFM